MVMAPGSVIRRHSWHCDQPFRLDGAREQGHKQLGSHNLLATPASTDFNDEILKPLLTEYLRGAENTDAEERARLFRTARISRAPHWAAG